MMIRFSVACIILILTVHFQNWSVEGGAMNSRSVCHDKDCNDIARMYQQHMNKPGSPCTDFYDYVCSEWGIQNPRPESADIWAVENVMIDNGLNKLKQILEDRKVSTTDVQHAKLLYKTCVQLPHLPSSSPEILKKIMMDVGNWPTFRNQTSETGTDVPWSMIDNQYMKQTSESALFDMDLVIAVDDKYNVIFPEFKLLESPYGRTIRREDWGGLFSHQKSHYKNFLRIITELVGPQNPKSSKSVIENDITDVVKFRTQLNDIINSFPPTKVFELMKVKDLQAWYDNLAQGQANAQIDWLSKVRTLFPTTDTNGVPINGDTLVHVQKLYFSRLVELLKKTPQRAILNHIHLYFAERHLTLPPDAVKALEQSIKKDTKPTGIIRYSQPRWQKCINEHNMQITLRKMYISSVFSPSIKTEVNDIIKETKNLLLGQILETTWLDQETKSKTMNRVDHITSSIGNEAWLNASSTVQMNSATLEDPLKPEAYFIIPYNQLYVSASFLQMPRFSLKVPYAIRYGSTVFTFGHELYHSLDPEVLEYNLDGKKWSKMMLSKLNNQLQCFEEYFNKKRNRQVNTVTRMVSQLPETLSEDVADVMGAKLAYRGYKQTFLKSNSSCPTLPGFEKATCDQLFFIALGNTFCSDSAPTAVKELLLTDTHSSPRTRVNGIVSNMKEFGAAFGCTPKDKMMRQRTCDLWKN